MALRLILLCLTLLFLEADEMATSSVGDERVARFTDARYLYDDFGGAEIYDGNWNPRSVSAYGNRYQYTGQEWWPELGLHNYKARFYSSELGRFLQNDPLRFDAGDLNLYRYVGNNVVNLTDPDGEVLFVPILIFAAKMAVDYAVDQAIKHVENTYLSEDQKVWTDRAQMAWDGYKLVSGNPLQIGKTVNAAVQKGGKFLKKKANKARQSNNERLRNTDEVLEQSDSISEAKRKSDVKRRRANQEYQDLEEEVPLIDKVEKSRRRVKNKLNEYKNRTPEEIIKDLEDLDGGD